jgi:hypothetical protein
VSQRAALVFFAAAAVGLSACSGASDQPPTDTAASTAPGTSPSADALVEGTGFHATGNIPCSMGGDRPGAMPKRLLEAEPAGSCLFGVTRQGDGNGMVTVTKPDGRRRVIFFEKGKAIGYGVSEADPGKFSASREGDTTIVRIGTERYEIPDAVILGG